MAAAGVAQLAAFSGAQVLPVAAWTRWALQFRSWDRMRFPLPFGRGRLVFGDMITVPRHDWEGSLPAIEAAVTQASDLRLGDGGKVFDLSLEKDDLRDRYGRHSWRCRISASISSS